MYNAGTVGKDFNLTSPSTDLAKKYNGYKYSVAPLKQTCETIMVFSKPKLTGSVLHDTLKMEDGLKLKEQLTAEIKKESNEKVVFEGEKTILQIQSL